MLLTAAVGNFKGQGMVRSGREKNATFRYFVADVKRHPLRAMHNDAVACLILVIEREGRAPLFRGGIRGRDRFAGAVLYFDGNPLCMRGSYACRKKEEYEEATTSYLHCQIASVQSRAHRAAKCATRARCTKT